MAAQLIYTEKPSGFQANKIIVLGEAQQLKNEQFLNTGLNTILSHVEKHGLNTLIKAYSNKPDKNHTAIVGSEDNHVSITIASIDAKKGRHTGIIRSDVIPNLVSKHLDDDKEVQITFLVEPEQALAAGSAVARAFPEYSRKASFHKKEKRTVYINFVAPSGQPLKNIDLVELQHVSDNIRLAARLTDTPCSELNTDTYVEQVRELIKDLPNVKLEVIQGEELDRRGFGGLWGVGKAAVHLPALAILSYEPSNKNESTKSIALVGKGICYDTGGLSLKSTTAMPTMKVDMGGSAAVLGAFLSAVKTQSKHILYGLLCLAENSCDQLSTRPDDILTIYSNKTVEVNNTDAEGRLVLADGVAYASKDLKVDHIIDIATLTGAQLIATGPRHAGIMSNNPEFEQNVLKAAHSSGDLAHPLIYCPEFLLKDLESEVADLKNSNKNGPTTAASSLAGHFIEAHLHPDYKGVWTHIDIAGPATKGHRATGFGVALLYKLVKDQI